MKLQCNKYFILKNNTKREEIVVPNKTIYKIVNQFFVFGRKHPEEKNLCFQVWLHYDGIIEDFPIYALVAKRYGFSKVKRRFDKWYENDTRIMFTE